MAKIDAQNSNKSFGLKNAAKITVGILLMNAFPKRRLRMEPLATIPWHEDQQPDAAD